MDLLVCLPKYIKGVIEELQVQNPVEMNMPSYSRCTVVLALRVPDFVSRST